MLAGNDSSWKPMSSCSLTDEKPIDLLLSSGDIVLGFFSTAQRRWVRRIGSNQRPPALILGGQIVDGTLFGPMSDDTPPAYWRMTSQALCSPSADPDLVELLRLNADSIDASGKIREDLPAALRLAALEIEKARMSEPQIEGDAQDDAIPLLRHVLANQKVLLGVALQTHGHRFESRVLARQIDATTDILKN